MKPASADTLGLVLAAVDLKFRLVASRGTLGLKE